MNIVFTESQENIVFSIANPISRNAGWVFYSDVKILVDACQLSAFVCRV